ncbi:hypothetical protein Tco_0168630 [Tanacetum coccineum]
MINKIDALWKICSERFDNNPTHGITTNGPTRVHAMSLDHLGSKEPPNKEVIKSLSKLMSPKYQEQSSLKIYVENTPSPKRVYFVNTIAVVKKEDEPKDASPREHEGPADVRKIEPSWMKNEIGGGEIRRMVR